MNTNRCFEASNYELGHQMAGRDHPPGFHESTMRSDAGCSGYAYPAHGHEASSPSYVHGHPMLIDDGCAGYSSLKKPRLEDGGECSSVPVQAPFASFNTATSDAPAAFPAADPALDPFPSTLRTVQAPIAINTEATSYHPAVFAAPIPSADTVRRHQANGFMEESSFDPLMAKSGPVTPRKLVGTGNDELAADSAHDSAADSAHDSAADSAHDSAAESASTTVTDADVDANPDAVTNTSLPQSDEVRVEAEAARAPPSSTAAGVAGGHESNGDESTAPTNECRAIIAGGADVSSDAEIVLHDVSSDAEIVRHDVSSDAETLRHTQNGKASEQEQARLEALKAAERDRLRQEGIQLPSLAEAAADEAVMSSIIYVYSAQQDDAWQSARVLDYSSDGNTLKLRYTQDDITEDTKVTERLLWLPESTYVSYAPRRKARLAQERRVAIAKEKKQLASFAAATSAGPSKAAGGSANTASAGRTSNPLSVEPQAGEPADVSGLPLCITALAHLIAKRSAPQTLGRWGLPIRRASVLAALVAGKTTTHSVTQFVLKRTNLCEALEDRSCGIEKVINNEGTKAGRGPLWTRTGHVLALAAFGELVIGELSSQDKVMIESLGSVDELGARTEEEEAAEEGRQEEAEANDGVEEGKEEGGEKAVEREQQQEVYGGQEEADDEEEKSGHDEVDDLRPKKDSGRDFVLRALFSGCRTLQDVVSHVEAHSTYGKGTKHGVRCSVSDVIRVERDKPRGQALFQRVDPPGLEHVGQAKILLSAAGKALKRANAAGRSSVHMFVKKDVSDQESRALTSTSAADGEGEAAVECILECNELLGSAERFLVRWRKPATSRDERPARESWEPGRKLPAAMLQAFVDESRVKFNHLLLPALGTADDPFGVVPCAVNDRAANKLAGYLRRNWKGGQLLLNSGKRISGYATYSKVLDTHDADQQSENTLLSTCLTDTSRAHANASTHMVATLRPAFSRPDLCFLSA